MTDKLKDWSTTAASNNSTPPFGWPEGMAPSAVNNSARQGMASVAEWYADPEWVRYAHSIVSSTSSTVVITGDVTDVYVADRAVRLDQDDAKIGYVSSSSYSAPNTTVNITGLTVASPTIIEVGLVKQAGSLPADIDAAAKTYADDIAKRAGGSTYLNGIGTITSLTSGSGNWTVPAGVYRVKYTVTGGGGGGGGRGAGNGSGGDGGNTTFNSTIVAVGGKGGATAVGTSGPAGGGASGGDINIPGGGGGPGGGDGDSDAGGASFWGGGGFGGYSTGGGDGLAYGSGGGGGSTGSNAASSGSAGGTCIGILTVTPGDLIPYSVGAAGAAGTGAQPGGAGAGGIIVLEY